MKAIVTNPSGISDVCDISMVDIGQYTIKFIPQEMGIHMVFIKHMNILIPGGYSFTIVNYIPIPGGYIC